MGSSWRTLLRYWFQPDTVRRALTVAAIVTPVLVLINHGEALLSLEVTPRLVGKTLLTFFVPYAVSSFSSARALSRAELSTRARHEAETSRPGAT